MLAVFPYIMATLQAGAALTSLYYGNYRLAVIWSCAMTSNIAIAGLR